MGGGFGRRASGVAGPSGRGGVHDGVERKVGLMVGGGVWDGVEVDVPAKDW